MEPLTGTGRVCGVSASSAPSVTTSVTPASRASPSTVEQKCFQRKFGSGALNSSTSRSDERGRACHRVGVGQCSTRAPSSSGCTMGRVTWKS